MKELWEYERQYPDVPGAKRAGTSTDAAIAMQPRAGTIKHRILTLMQDGQHRTPDEAAVELGLSVLAVRPRFTELAAAKLVTETGDTRKNDSGQKANVYRIAGVSHG